MRILALTNLCPTPWQSGRAPFNRQLLLALAPGHALRIIAPVPRTDEFSARWRGAPGLPPGRQRVLDGITVDHPRYLFPPKILRALYGRCFLRSVRPTFERAVREFRPDVVCGSWAYPDGWAAVELGRHAGAPVVIRVHGSDINPLAAQTGRQAGTRAALCRADAVIAPSRELAARLLQFGVSPARTHVVYNGVDSGLFHPGSRSDARRHLGLSHTTPIVLFVGQLAPAKGLDVLLEACAALVADNVHFSCVLIGGGPLLARLQRQRLQRGLTDHVTLLGEQPHADLPDWYRAVDVLVLPSRSEGVPNVLIEAVACGTRYVATSIGGIPEITRGDTGRLVPAGDSLALARSIRKELTRVPSRAPGPARPPRSFADAALDLAAVLASVVAARTPPGQTDIERRAPSPVESA